MNNRSQHYRALRDTHLLYVLLRFTRTKLILFLFALNILVQNSSAQQSNTIYLLEHIIQSSQLNPAVRPACDLVVGIPFLNTLHFEAFNSAFSFNDIADGSNLLLDEVYSKLNRMNMFGAEVITYPFNFGFKYNEAYISFSVAERINTYISYKKKLAGFVLYGNAPFVGEMARFTNTRVNANYYREYALGYAKPLNKYTSVGVKGKLLFGKAGINTGRSRARVGTDLNTYDLSVLGDVRVNAAMPVNIEVADQLISRISFDEPNYYRFFLNGRNPGLAADFGVIHRFSPDLTFSASLLDVGMMVWTDDPYNVAAEVDFSYEGVSEGTDFTRATYFRDLYDSIYNDILYDVSRKPYVSFLPPQLYLGAEYHWNQNLDLGLVVRNSFINRHLVSSVTASASTVLLNRFQGAVSWSYMNNSLLNVGLALGYVGRGLQVYAASDNLVGFISPLNTRSLNFRIGMNLMLGCPVKYNRYIIEERQMVPCPKGARVKLIKNRRKNKKFLQSLK